MCVDGVASTPVQYCVYVFVLLLLLFFSLLLLDYEGVVKLSENFNGADLRNVCTEAGTYAQYVPLTYNDIHSCT